MTVSPAVTPALEQDNVAPGYVYFMRCRDLVKIGFSTQVDIRAQNLRTMNAAAVEVVASFAGTRFDERRLHRQFARYRRHGEWFEWCDEIEAVAVAGFDPGARMASRQPQLSPVMRAVKSALSPPKRAQQLAALTGQPLSICQKTLSGHRVENREMIDGLMQTRLILDVLIAGIRPGADPVARKVRKFAQQLQLDLEYERRRARIEAGDDE